MASRDRLRALALLALDDSHGNWEPASFWRRFLRCESEANFVAATTPQAVLALSDESEEKIRSLQEFCRRFVHCDMECYKHGDGPAPEGSGGHYPDCAITQREALLAKIAT